MTVVVIGVEMRMKERRAHCTALNGECQTECHRAADHAAILSHNVVGAA